MMDHMVTDAFRSVIDAPANRITDTENVEEEIPNPSCERFFNLLKAANEPIYEGCSQSKLSISVRLLAARANWHIPQGVLTFLQRYLQICPLLRIICLRIIMKQQG